MADKSSLYRQTAVRRPISGIWSRLAAAAIVAGMGWFLLSEGNEPVNILPQNTPTQQVGETPVNQTTITPGLQVEETSTASSTNTTPQKPALRTTNENQQADLVDQTVKLNTKTRENGEEEIIAKTPSIARTTDELSPAHLISTTTQTHIENTAPTVHTQNMVASTAVHLTNPTAQNQPDEYEFAREEEPEYLYIAGTKIKKQKVRGFIRTVGRTVTRGFTNGNIAQVEEQPIP